MWNGLWLKCHNTDDYYFLERFNSVGYRGKVCSDDPHFYQACDNTLKGFRVTNDTILCNNYFCDRSERSFQAIRYYKLVDVDVCGMNCLNTDQNKMECQGNDTSENKTLSLGQITSTKICDDTCDILGCEDEARCNNLTYGIYCSSTEYGGSRDLYGRFGVLHHPPQYVCDRRRQSCDYEDDEYNCRITENTENICVHKITFAWVPVHNYTRCATIHPCLLYTSPSPRDQRGSRMPSSA